MAIPRTTNRLHLKPYWLGDSPAAIRRTAARRIGKRFVDINFQRCADGVVAVHWGTARMNGYYYITTSNGKRRKMTRAELDRPISRWKVADVKRWRRTPRRTLRYESKVRPYTFLEMVRYSKRYRVIICAELKSRSFANETVARSMVKQAKAEKWTVYYMTLVTMQNWGPKLKAFKEAGGETALLAHGARKPANLAQWMPYIDRIWGRWR